MVMGTAKACFDTDIGMTDDFKTVGKYGFQPLLISAEVKEMLAFFIEYIRGPMQKLNAELLDANSFLFPSRKYGDRNPVNVGRYLKSFFERCAGLNLTSTTLRTLMTSEVRDLFLEGKITSKEKDSVDKVNGHSNEIAERHYLLRDMEENARHAIQVSEVLRGSPSTPITDIRRPSVFNNLTSNIPRSAASSVVSIHDMQWKNKPWGNARCKSSTRSRRFPWIEEEMNIIGIELEKIASRFPDNVIPKQTSIVPRLLLNIRASDEAVPYFLIEHLENNQRLSHGIHMTFVYHDYFYYYYYYYYELQDSSSI